MNHFRLASALRKLGITAIQDPCRNKKWIATKNGRALLWYAYEDETTRGTVIRAQCVHAPHPDTDATTDYFCDTFFNTIKAATQYMRGH